MTMTVGRQGLLAADLVGFHTYDYARHFLSACRYVCTFWFLEVGRERSVS